MPWLVKLHIVSAWVLIALPFALALFLVRTNPGYLEPLYTTTFGIILIILALVSIGLGVWVISKILDLEA